VEMIPLPAFELGADTALCAGESINFTIGQEGDSIRWFNAAGTALSTSGNFTYKVLQTDTLIAEIVRRGCLFQDTIVVGMLPLPIANAGADVLICYGTATTLGGQPAASGASSPYSYKWYPAHRLNNPALANPVAQPDTTTTYILTVTDAKGCSSYDTIVVTVNPATVLNAGSDVTICYGDQAQLGGAPTAQGSVFPYTYKWFPADGLNSDSIANPIANPTETTTYTLIVQTHDCKPDTATVTVTVNPLPVITTSPDVSIGYKQGTVLTATGGEYYQWTDLNSEQVVAESAEVEVAPLVNTSYLVLVTDSNGCSKTDTVNVFIRNEVFVPNLFTPNGDGNNDYFTVYGFGINTFTFKVFNRAGQMMYETSSLEEILSRGWDGTYKGVPQSSGTYQWTLEGTFHDGTVLNYQGKKRGTINLLR
jgi:gliding motility-associated-like protein